MKLLDDYFKLQKELYEYFGYEEDWVVIPLDDSTEYKWKITEDEVQFWDKDNEEYSNEIYTQRFLPTSVYRGKDYTMIVVDTHTDGNKFLQVFDNKKEIK